MRVSVPRLTASGSGDPVPIRYDCSPRCDKFDAVRAFGTLIALEMPLVRDRFCLAVRSSACMTDVQAAIGEMFCVEIIGRMATG